MISQAWFIGVLALLLIGNTISFVRMESNYSSLNTKVDGINNRLDRQNGRVGKIEKEQTDHIKDYHSDKKGK